MTRQATLVVMIDSKRIILTHLIFKVLCSNQRVDKFLAFGNCVDDCIGIMFGMNPTDNKVLFGYETWRRICSRMA